MLGILELGIEKIKKRIVCERNSALIEGIILSLFVVIALIFDPDISKITLYYLFPIALIFFGATSLYNAARMKEMEINLWIMLLMQGLSFIFIACWFGINPIESAKALMMWVGILALYRNLIKLFTTPNKIGGEYLQIILMIVIGSLLIVYPEAFLDISYYITLSIVALYGVFKLMIANALNKLMKKKKIKE